MSLENIDFKANANYLGGFAFQNNNLKPLDNEFKTRENKVEGRDSQVWVRAYLDFEKNVVFKADSDLVLTKGLAVLLVQGLSSRPIVKEKESRGGKLIFVDEKSHD
uniref:Fe-S metabolism associated domain-containing protein n=1 Tax=Salix viminalis TaxID=40686 RepID=A0A6N2K8B9_SALVM